MNLKKLQKTIERIGETLQPEDDWMPTLILEGRKETTIFGFVGDSMCNEFAKNEAASQMTKLIQEFKPDCACFITTAWSLGFEKEEINEEEMEAIKYGRIKISQHPNRIEIVSAYCYGERGPNEGEVLMMGFIQRFSTKSPRIKKWKVFQDGAEAEGKFPDAIKEGFKLAKGG